MNNIISDINQALSKISRNYINYYLLFVRSKDPFKFL
jgi:hypothetical protein